MKRFFTSLCLSIAIISFTSCEEDVDPPAIYEVPGLYVGTYTISQQPATGALYYSFSFTPNGKLTTIGAGGNGKTYYSAGTWTKTGNAINCVYTTLNFDGGPQVTQSAQFTFDSGSGNLTNGTWADGANGSNFTGSFPTMDRVK